MGGRPTTNYCSLLTYRHSLRPLYTILSNLTKLATFFLFRQFVLYRTKAKARSSTVSNDGLGLRVTKPRRIVSKIKTRKNSLPVGSLTFDILPAWQSRFPEQPQCWGAGLHPSPSHGLHAASLRSGEQVAHVGPLRALLLPRAVRAFVPPGEPSRKHRLAATAWRPRPPAASDGSAEHRIDTLARAERV